MPPFCGAEPQSGSTERFAAFRHHIVMIAKYSSKEKGSDYSFRMAGSTPFVRRLTKSSAYFSAG